MGSDPDHLAEARRWRDADPDPFTRADLDALIRIDDRAALAELFEHRLEFGTAGLRGAVGLGPARMNRLNCALTAAAVARVLEDHVDDARNRGVVVARDARAGSEQFAAEMAGVFSRHGINVRLIDGPAPTPLGAFAVRHLGAAAGIVVTASHNPPQDNGIKVFWSDGAQISAPVDRWIADALDEVWTDNSLEPTDQDPARIIGLGRVAERGPLVEAYLAEAASVPGIGRASQPDRSAPVVAHTALHGVGAELLEMAVDHFGVATVFQVASQREPDAEFPTVAFPNPEEPGAMDAVLALAAEVSAVAAIANDPDADRMALAVPDHGGSWRILTGDETGVLLAWYLLGAVAGDDHASPEQNLLVATTVVSSRLLGAMARTSGIRFVETLTGFKHLCRPALDHPDWTQVIAYEEALGYAIGPQCRDKDGITASLVACSMLGHLAATGRTVWDVLDDLARVHGAHVTSNGSRRLTGSVAPQRMAVLSESLRSNPPGELGGLTVSSVEHPASDVLVLHLEDRTRVVLRPSGTEPKFKYYCEAIEDVAPSEAPDSARRRAADRLARVVTALEPLIS